MREVMCYALIFQFVHVSVEKLFEIMGIDGWHVLRFERQSDLVPKSLVVALELLDLPVEFQPMLKQLLKRLFVRNNGASRVVWSGRSERAR